MSGPNQLTRSSPSGAIWAESEMFLASTSAKDCGFIADQLSSASTINNAIAPATCIDPSVGRVSLVRSASRLLKDRGSIPSRSMMSAAPSAARSIWRNRLANCFHTPSGGSLRPTHHDFTVSKLTFRKFAAPFCERPQSEIADLNVATLVSRHGDDEIVVFVDDAAFVACLIVVIGKVISRTVGDCDQVGVNGCDTVRTHRIQRSMKLLPVEATEKMIYNGKVGEDDRDRLRAENAELVAAANKLADQVDHCLLGYAISRQNGLSIEDAMLNLRVACNEYRSVALAKHKERPCP
jgi:hypothetical protein